MRALGIAIASALLISCGSERVIVIQASPPAVVPSAVSDPTPLTVAGPPSASPVPAPPPKQVAVDPRASRCDLDVTSRLGSTCDRLRGIAAFGTGAEAAAAQAFDGDACTIWNSGGFAPQSATLELGAPSEISRIVLVPEMTPTSATVTNEIHISDDGKSFRRIGQLRVAMRTGEPIELPIPGGVTTRFVRVVTTESPSWVAWRDILVIRCGNRR